MKVTEFDLNDVIIKKGLKINESDGINACRIILFFLEKHSEKFSW